MTKPRTTPVKPWTMAEKEQMKQHFERWKRLGPILEGLAFWQARRRTPTQRARDLAELLAGQRPGTPNDASGWIAWQKVRERWLAHNENKRLAMLKNEKETRPRSPKSPRSLKSKIGNTVS